MPRRAVVVGAGPAGILASVYLTQLGFDEVVVYERREEPGEEQRGSQHSYPMVLSSRAMMAFADAGVAPACTSEAAGAIPCGGHFASGKLRTGGGDPRVPLPAELVTWVVDRVGLAADLLAEARRVCPDRIRFVFGAALAELDLAGRRAVFQVGPAGKQEQVVESGYELLVGADGANSAVRGFMQAQVPGFRTQLLYNSPARYKTFHGLPRDPPGDSGQELVPGIGQHRPRQHLYWFDHRLGPMVTFWLTADGRLDGLVSKVTDWEPSSLSSRISSVHPSIPAHLVEAIVAQVGEQPGSGAEGAEAGGSRFGRILTCSALHGPRCVLLGDAAHPVTGHLGQAEGFLSCSGS
ncbi:hypothetical protein GPECTOR_7g1350 [Gonium pectorale]|uniref:FAD-binding domain-containing protein n=1 Tax=Gonium pectorale TaxID=33097 RepID=A0A150GUF0_GONPE|nr:hypothetical protein GPECTOR_7g1350 [Gonium pectorale]|eukprot:KXZ53451.1 hypothetical protein GPECTOR_7g1350 [Gonium pectorale]